MWQADNATSHSANKTKFFVNEHFGENNILKFPPSSPDLTPIDYAVNNHLKNLIKKEVGLRAKPDDIRTAILTCWGRISQKYFDQVIDSLPKRLQACVDAKGDIFEHLIH